MSIFRLPENSKVRRDGKVYKAQAGAKDLRVFRIYRFDPDAAEAPRLDTYEIDMAACGPMGALVEPFEGLLSWLSSPGL